MITLDSRRRDLFTVHSCVIALYKKVFDCILSTSPKVVLDIVTTELDGLSTNVGELAHMQALNRFEHLHFNTVLGSQKGLPVEDNHGIDSAYNIVRLRNVNSPSPPLRSRQITWKIPTKRSPACLFNLYSFLKA